MLVSTFARKLSPVALAFMVTVFVGAVWAQPLAAQATFNSGQPGYPNWSPWSGVRFEADQPVVEVDGEWFQLVSIHGVTVDELRAACVENDWQFEKRLAEDIVQMLRVMGHEIERTTDLELIDDSGETITLADGEMTVENRTRINVPAANGPGPIVADGNPFDSGAPGYPLWAAFSGLKWEEDGPHVLVEGQWYRLLTIHGVSVDAIRRSCEENRWDFEHRFAEDHVQLLRLMGEDIDRTTSLTLRDDSGEIFKFDDVEMTGEKHAALRANVFVSISRQQALEDIDAFQTGLEQQFSYLRANDVDYIAALDAIREKVPEEPELFWLAGELQQVMAMFIDGHASVDGTRMVAGNLPFLIVPSENRFVAIQTERDELLEKDFPYIKAIDGLEIECWLQATEKNIARGSRQYRTRHGLRHLRSIRHFQSELGIDTSGDIRVGLESPDGQSVKTVTLAVAENKPIFGEWPVVRQPEILDGNIGYLRIESMDDESVALLQQWMPRFENTDGLIIDVRGNGGGSREALLELAGYLMSSEDEPRIGNVAKYRLFRDFDKDHLSNARFVYREKSAKFGDKERAAIGRFKESFQPQWKPADDEFSEWHYLVLSKSDDDPRSDYKKPVTILMDEYCFSATDVFLGAFKGWPNVTLIGAASGGGSARIQEFELPNSRISVRCASMASFQPDGILYDTNGVEPDIIVERPPEYYLHGGPDVILDRAIEVINGERGSK